MVTGLVCIWSVGSETDVHRRQRGERVVDTEREMGEGEKEVSMGVMSSQGSHVLKKKKSLFLSVSLSLTLTNTLSQSAYPQLWEFHGISVIACLYLRNALSGLRALLISGGLDWLLSAEHTQ